MRLLKSGGRGFATAAEGKELLRVDRQLEQAGDVFTHLAFPERPVVAAFGAPIVHGVADSFAGKHFGEAIRGSAVFPGTGAGDEVDVAGIVLLVIPAVGEIGKVIDGIVEVKIVVVHAVHEISQVVDTGHGETAFEDVGMLEESVGGVIRAEGSAHGGDGNLRLAVIPDERNDLFAEIGIENGLDVAAMKRMSTLVVKAEAIDGIDGIELDAASIDEIGEGTDHALAFEFPFVAGTGGKTDERRTPMTVSDDSEIEAEARRVPAMVFTFHQKGL